MITPSDKQVRERLISRGAEALTDEELVSLVLPAVGGEESIAVAGRLLEKAGSLVALAHSSPRELRQMEGLGMERAAKLSAAFELGRRVLATQGEEQMFVKDRNDVVSLFAPLLSSLNHEEMWVLYLSSSNRIIERRKISLGGASLLVADSRLILRHALNLVATSLIVVHNHPSGASEPSGEDEAFTARLKDAAGLLDITLLDHIIIARGGGSYSFRGAGKL